MLKHAALLILIQAVYDEGMMHTDVLALQIGLASHAFFDFYVELSFISQNPTILFDRPYRLQGDA